MDVVLSICLQSNVSTGQTGLSTQLAAGPVPSTSDLSGSSKSHPIPSGSSFKPMRDRQPGKRKDLDSMCPLYHFQYACYAYKIRNTLCLLSYKIGNIFFGHRCHLWEIFVIHFMNFNAWRHCNLFVWCSNRVLCSRPTCCNVCHNYARHHIWIHTML